MLGNIICVLIALVLLYVIAKILKWPLKVLWKLIVNGLLGVVLLVIVNLIGGYFDVSIGINIVTSLIAGFFGIPGVIFLIIFSVI